MVDTRRLSDMKEICPGSNLVVRRISKVVVGVWKGLSG